MSEWWMWLILILVSIPLVYLCGFIGYSFLYIWERWINNGIDYKGKEHITMVVLGLLIVIFIYLIQFDVISFSINLEKEYIPIPTY